MILVNIMPCLEVCWSRLLHMLGSCFVICLFECYVFGCLASTYNVLTWCVMPVFVPELFACSVVLGRNLASPVSCGAQPELMSRQTKTYAAF